MLMTTLGSEYWPHTAEGRVLAFLLALYAFTVFGYVTAILASFFVGHTADRDALAPTAAEVRALRTEIAELRAALALRAEADRRG